LARYATAHALLGATLPRWDHPLRLHLSLQLVETLGASSIEQPVIDSALDGATGFALVPAVAESALAGEVRDVIERCAERFAVAPKAELAHSRSIDDASAPRQLNELTRRRRMAPCVVTGARWRGACQRAPEQVVEQGGFTDTGRAEQRRRHTAAEVLPGRMPAMTSIACTGTDRAIASTWRTCSSSAGASAAFVSKTTGAAPLACVNAR